MRKQHTYKPVALRFRRWSRKGYAAFVSIQRAVTIGQLAAHVSERFQIKNGTLHTSVLAFNKAGEKVVEEEENTYSPDSPGRLLSLLLLPLVCPVQTVSPSAASPIHILYREHFRIAEGPGHKPESFRDFRLYKHTRI